MNQKSLRMYQLNYLFGEARISKSLCNNTGGTIFLRKPIGEELNF